ncbi:hypothetical protein [Neomegalonema sp.]|uniref:hypothetical protein n=1 Tax=Neomegalonema sp. TaxID=2039713 RepID=UPI00260891F6|nr:hypothetical protein [Neomegalonema sp.]MDD2867460.1 hypothetical protein [Neomegalonema sp.]
MGVVRRMMLIGALAVLTAPSPGRAQEELGTEVGTAEDPSQALDCVERFELRRTRPGAADVRISSACRKGGEVADFSIGDYVFSAAFDDLGQAQATLPLLGRLTLLNWSDAEGRPRAELIEFPDYDGTLQIALIWAGEADLDLLLAEAPGPFPGERIGRLTANVTSRRPNLEEQAPETKEGYGRLVLSDAGGAEGHHAEVYVLEAARNPVRRGLRARGRIEPRVEVSLEGAAREAACRALAGGAERVHFTLHVNAYGASRIERQALGAAACDPQAPRERRLMRADFVDFGPGR